VSQRFISNVALAIAGAAVVVASQAFSSSVTGWVTFGVSLGALALVAVVQRGAMNERGQRALDAAIGLLAVWSAVASVVLQLSNLWDDRSGRARTRLPLESLRLPPVSPSA
jgi:uncharacterized membrane protein YccC